MNQLEWTETKNIDGDKIWVYGDKGLHSKTRGLIDEWDLGGGKYRARIVTNYEILDAELCDSFERAKEWAEESLVSRFIDNFIEKDEEFENFRKEEG